MWKWDNCSNCYIALESYTCSGEVTAHFQTSPGRPGLVFLSASAAFSANASSQTSRPVDTDRRSVWADE